MTTTAPIKVTISGYPYKLDIDWYGLSALQQMFGEDYVQTVSSGLLRQRTDIIMAVLSVGLKKHHPDITEEAIIKGMPPLIEATRACIAAMEIAFFGKTGDAE